MTLIESPSIRTVSRAGQASSNWTPVMDVKIMFWNDTDSNDTDGCIVSIGDSSWEPDTSGDSDTGTIAGLGYDEPLAMVVRPSGAGGPEFTVDVTFTSIMEPGSEQDAIHVEISDARVRIIGNAVDNFDVVFDRADTL